MMHQYEHGDCLVCGTVCEEATKELADATAEYVFSSGELSRRYAELDEEFERIKAVNGSLFLEITGEEEGFYEPTNTRSSRVGRARKRTAARA